MDIVRYRKRKKAAKFIIITGIIYIVLNVLIDNPYVHSIVKAGVNQQLRSAAELTLSYQSIKVGLLPPRVDLIGVSLATSGTKEKVLGLSQVTLKISLFALFFAPSRVGILELYDFAIFWPLPAPLQKLFDSLKNKNPNKATAFIWPPKFDFPLSKFKVTNARIVFSQQTKEAKPPLKAEFFEGSVEGLDLNLNFESWKKADLDIYVERANLKNGPNSLLENGKLNSKFRLRELTIGTEFVELESARLNVNSDVKAELELNNVNELSKITLKSTGEAKGDLSVLGSVLDIEKTSGKTEAKFNAAVKIPVSSKEKLALEVLGEAKVTSGKMFDFKLFNAAAKFKVDLEKIVFEKITLAPKDKKVLEARGQLGFDDAVKFDFEADADALKFDDLMDVFGVNFDILDFQLTGKKLSIKGQGAPFFLSANIENAVANNFDLPATPYAKTNFPKSPECQTTIQVYVDVKAVKLDGTNLQCLPGDPRSKIAVGGKVDLGKKTSLDITIRSDQLNLQIGEFFSQVPLTGIGFLNTKIYGPTEKILIDTQFSFKSPRILKIPLGDMKGFIRVDSKSVNWKDLETVNVQDPAQARFSAKSGSLQISTMIIDSDLVLENILSQDLQNLFAFYDVKNIKFGINSARGHLHGNIFKPLAMTGDLKLKLNSFSFDNEKIVEQFTAQVLSNEKDLEVNSARAELGGLVVNSNLNITKSAILKPSNTLESLGLSLSQKIILKVQTEKNSNPTKPILQTLPLIGSYLETAKVDGTFDINGEFIRQNNQISGAFDLTLRELSFLGGKLAPVHILGSLDKSRADLRIGHSGQSLTGRLMVDLGSNNLDYEWFFYFQRLELRSVLTSLLSVDPRNFLYLSGSWEMHGNFMDWWASHGKLTLEDSVLRVVTEREDEVKNIEMIQEKPVHLNIARNNWQLAKDEFLTLTGEFLDLRVDFEKIKLPSMLKIKIKSLCDMSVLSYLHPKFESTAGKMKIEGTVDGPVSDLKINFLVSDQKKPEAKDSKWLPVAFGYADARPLFKDIDFAVRLQNDGVKIEKFSALKGSGKVKVAGYYHFSQDDDENPQEVETTRLMVDFDQASLTYPIAFLKSFESNLSGSVTISGSNAPYLMEGNLTIKRSRSSREVDLRNEIVNSFRNQKTQSTTANIDPFLNFDLTVVADHSINILNRNMQMVLSSNLHLTGTNVTPLLSGEVAINRGKFDYKREFQIQKGLVIFDDPVKIDPNLDISALCEVGSYRVYLTVTGNASDPVVDFQVDPPTKQDGTPIRKVDVLVLLSRGNLPTKEGISISSTAKTGPSEEDARSSAATSEALNIFAGQLNDPVEKLFDLQGQKVVKQVFVDTYPDDSGKTTARFNLPLNLGDDLDVILKADASKYQVTSEYSLHQGIFVTGAVERKNAEPTTRAPKLETGLDLKFRFSFQ